MNKYYIWEEQNCKGINPKWIEIGKGEFLECENKSIRFIEYNFDDDKPYKKNKAFLQVTEEQYKDWKSKQNRKYYLKEKEKEIQMLSLEAHIPNNSDITFEDFLKSNIDIYEEIETKLMIEKLYKIITQLNEDERFIIKALLYRYNNDISEAELCSILNIKKSTFNYRKLKLFKKILKMFEQN